MRTFKRLRKITLGMLFVVAGASHFVSPASYLRIMPPYLPWPLFLVYLSGFFEVALGAMLLAPAFTRVAAWGLVALLVAVFPANVHMALHPGLYPEISPVILWMRLPLQAVLVGWAHRYTRPDARQG